MVRCGVIINIYIVLRLVYFFVSFVMRVLRMCFSVKDRIGMYFLVDDFCFLGVWNCKEFGKFEC